MAVTPATAKSLRSDARRNRERIVASARALFGSKGVEVPVDEITRRAGVGMGTLYRHFPTKDDLVDAVLEEALDAYVELARRASAEDDGWAGFARFLEQALELHAANRALMDVVQTTDRGRERAQAARRRIRPLLRELVARAQAEGTLRDDLAAEDVPALFWAGARVIEATESVAPGYWRRHLGLVLDGLRTGAASPLARPPMTSTQLGAANRRGS